MGAPKGRIPWNKGKPASEECKREFHYWSLIRAGQNRGKTNEEIYGRDKAAVIGRRMSSSRKGQDKGKSWEEKCGIEKACERKEKLRQRNSRGNPGLDKIRTLPHGFLGKRHSEETKRKLSLALKGKGKDKVGAKNPFYGRKHSADTIAKYSVIRRLQGNNMWRGGLSFEPYAPGFNKYTKEKIRARDNYTCQLCNNAENGKKHHVHHIDYDKKNSGEGNLITLCVRCNAKVNANRIFWQSHFTNLLRVR